MWNDFDFDTFWENSDYARQEYVERTLTPELVGRVEAELCFRLPASYVSFMRRQNGGIPARTCFPTATRTSWAADHIAIAGLLGVGHEKTYSLLGALGSKFMQEQWGYPRFGLCTCNCPSGGHDMVMFDYRACGAAGEPTVVHVDQESDFAVTLLAPDFETFVRGLVNESMFDDSKARLASALEAIRSGSLSTALTALLEVSSAPHETEASLRRLLAAIAGEKGCFALHGDPSSYLVYDVVFDLFAGAHDVRTPDSFLRAYRDIIPFGDGDVRTGGYGPKFLEDWMTGRRAAGEIVEQDGRLVLSRDHQHAVRERLGAVP